MEPIKSSSRLPFELRDKAFYKHSTDVIDYVVDKNYSEIANISQNLYNPNSPFFDPDRVINMLGFRSLANLMSSIEDKVSLSMLLADIANVKGLRRGFELILRILDLKYKTIIYQEVEDGCTEVTLVFDNGQRLSLDQISNVELLSREIFPLCISLRGLTNCDIYTKAIEYAGGPVTLGQHRLSRDFILDMSKLDTAFGHTEGSVSETIHLLLCNLLVSDLIYNTDEVNFETILGHGIVADFVYTRNAPNILDYNLVLDYFDITDYYMFTTVSGRITAHDLIYDGSVFTADVRRRRHNIYSFTLDDTKLDYDDLEPLDGHPNFSWYSPALSHNFFLSGTKLSSATKHYSNHITLSRHRTLSDLDAVVSYEASTVTESSGSLDFSKKFNSSYLPTIL